MNVLSLFDGMSCGQIALKELGIKVDNNFASEIDPFAIKQTQHNFPNTIQLGDVTTVKASELPRIDLLIGGSPCQGFSFAGKQLNFDDPRSILFFEFVRILREIREINPDVKFFLENVRMKKNSERVISEHLGVFPVVINSSLVSAQNRVRLYWSNIKTRSEGLFGDLFTDVQQPEDRGIFLKDILDDEVDKKYILKNSVVENLFKHKEKEKDNLIVQRPRGFNKGSVHDGKTPTLSSHAWEQNNLVIQLNQSKESGGKQPYQGYRVYSDEGKMICLDLDSRKNVLTNHIIRRLTPTECSRLQTIPDWYEWICSESQTYKMLGNGWTVEVIKHILKDLKPSLSRKREKGGRGIERDYKYI